MIARLGHDGEVELRPGHVVRTGVRMDYAEPKWREGRRSEVAAWCTALARAAFFLLALLGAGALGRFVAEATPAEVAPASRGAVIPGAPEFVVEATAYVAWCRGCTGYARWTNRRPVAGRTIACPEEWRGRVLEVETLGERVCEDTGGDIHARGEFPRIDVFMRTEERARRFGRRWLSAREGSER